MEQNLDKPIAASQPSIPVTFIGDRPRSKTVALDYPLQVGEHRITALEVHRMTVAQVEAFAQELRSGQDVSISAHMVTLPGGAPVPSGMFEALDDDDDARLFEVMQSFLPQRLRRVLALTPPAGGTTSPSSQVG